MSMESYLNMISTGDALELSKAIPDESIDLVFCDPPYLKRHIEAGVYSWLAREAARVLKPGGFCLAYTGSEWLPIVLRQMQDTLTFFWLCILRRSGSAGYDYNHKAIVRYTPIVACVKGKSKPPSAFLDCADGSGADKRFHIWGQDERTASYYIDCFSRPDDLVLDPFCGGGTVPYVCTQIQRRFIAFEIDPRSADVARKRLETVQPLLFSPDKPMQTTFDLEVNV
ncbi:MAG: DNA-methyltransferase [Ktedonobacteraceae bacterium]